LANMLRFGFMFLLILFFIFHFQDADKSICKHLKSSVRLIFHGKMRHSYPFCWRSNTPLIYKALPSFFVRVEDYREKLMENNSKTYWVPEFVKEKRFHNWLKEARDWCIGRNRYWGLSECVSS
jgi:isoleucyl-tRNA synthetase